MALHAIVPGLGHRIVMDRILGHVLLCSVALSRERLAGLGRRAVDPRELGHIRHCKPLRELVVSADGSVSTESKP